MLPCFFLCCLLQLSLPLPLPFSLPLPLIGLIPCLFFLLLFVLFLLALFLLLVLLLLCSPLFFVCALLALIFCPLLCLVILFSLVSCSSTSLASPSAHPLLPLTCALHLTFVLPLRRCMPFLNLFSCLFSCHVLPSEEHAMYSRSGVFGPWHVEEANHCK